jgi:hypothetical protein
VAEPGSVGPADGEGGGGGHIATNVMFFARALRAAGLKPGPAAVVDAIAALSAGGLGSREDVYWTLHACLVTRHEDSAVFDQAFGLFWRRRGLMEKMIALLSPSSPAAPRPDARPEAGALRVAEAFREPRERETDPVRELREFSARLTLSDHEVLKSRDFAQMSAEELAVARRLVRGLRLPDDAVPVRRLGPARRGAIDLRASLRRSVRSGGDSLLPLFHAPRRRPPPLVALVDISGSMAEYSRIFLHFLHAITDRRRRVHSFVFGTRLTNVTRLLRTRDPDEALALCGRAAPDWEGGTRIGAALGAFNRDWSRRVLGGGAVVLLFTDGLERQDLDRLAFETDRLRRSARQLVWLNPLLRFEAFEARASGIRALLPHVDQFRPIHSLASMQALVDALAAPAGRAHDPRTWLAAAA